jgi:hypothetical protein
MELKPFILGPPVQQKIIESESGPTPLTHGHLSNFQPFKNSARNARTCGIPEMRLRETPRPPHFFGFGYTNAETLFK